MPVDVSQRSGDTTRIDQFARSAILPQRSEWERRSPMHGGMRFSRWSALPERMISTRQISERSPRVEQSCHDSTLAAHPKGKPRGGAATSRWWETNGVFTKSRSSARSVGKPLGTLGQSTGSYQFGR
jgi:hypothetical protein